MNIQLANTFQRTHHVHKLGLACTINIYTFMIILNKPVISIEGAVDFDIRSQPFVFDD
jgi:hypothetical protein